LGGHLERCGDCGHERPVYNSCRVRYCPKCQSLPRARWLARPQAELLGTQCFHVVFTGPDTIAAIGIQNKHTVYKVLFRATAEALQTIAADPKHLGAEIGFLAVLHTWGQQLQLLTRTSSRRSTPVRKAFNHAVDKDGLIDIILEGRVSGASGRRRVA
jgi:hypothetical protein